MASAHYVTVTAEIPFKTVQRLDKLALEYGLSRANTVVRLLEAALMEHGEPIEVSAVTPDGERRDDGVALSIYNELRKLL